MEHNIDKELEMHPRDYDTFKKEALKTFKSENKDLYKKTNKQLDESQLQGLKKEEFVLKDKPEVFRLKQRPEHQSEFSKLKDKKEREEEINRMRELQNTFRIQHLTEEKKRKLEEEEKQKKERAEQRRLERLPNPSDRADFDRENSMISRNKTML